MIHIVKAIENYENICFKCLQEKRINTYSIYGRGYGSKFDGSNTKLQICDECSHFDLNKWFNEECALIDDYCERYNHEDEIYNFIDMFPLQGQELFLNRCMSGWTSHVMESQDWIDMVLGILPDEKYKEYGMYSPSEVKAYKERFPTCEHPVNVVYEDESKGCRCPFGVFGEYGQNEGLNYSDKCYTCEQYSSRETPIKEIKGEDFNDYQQYIISKFKMKKWKGKFE